jgi:uncharacterized repeat protein (TIGR03803 family)
VFLSVILDSSGNIYGTTSSGGSGGCGTVFALSGSTLTTLYSFTCGTDGGTPLAGVIRDRSGNLYGTAQSGGTNSAGVAYEVTSSGTFNVIYSFCSYLGCPDGAQPEGGLAMDASGNLYGTTIIGGTSDYGTVYELSKTGNGWNETVLHSFTGSDSAYPTYASPTLGTQIIGKKKQRVIFGVTEQGGGAADMGTAFEMVRSKSGYTLTVLHSFIGQYGDGMNPYGTLIYLKGKLFGTTSGSGNSNYGSVFELTQDKNIWHEAVLHNFTDSGGDGGNPYSRVVADSSGNLYGVTAIGGSGNGGRNAGGGIVYEVTP